MDQQDKWLLCAIKKDGHIVGSLLVDIGNSPDTRMPWLLYVTFKYANRPLPSSAEMDVFDKVDAIIRETCQKHKARNVAVYMKNGVRDWIVYAEDGPKFKRIAEKALSAYKPNVHAQTDRAWTQYLDFRNAATRNAPAGTVPRA